MPDIKLLTCHPISLALSASHKSNTQKKSLHTTVAYKFTNTNQVIWNQSFPKSTGTCHRLGLFEQMTGSENKCSITD